MTIRDEDREEAERPSGRHRSAGRHVKAGEL
jgi:hypothetical protein